MDPAGREQSVRLGGLIRREHLGDAQCDHALLHLRPETTPLSVGLTVAQCTWMRTSPGPACGSDRSRTCSFSVSRGSPETALRGSEAFGYVPAEGSSDGEIGWVPPGARNPDG